MQALNSEHPADLVIYDGECPFCRAQVARIARWDGRERLAFVSLHDPWVADRFPDLPRAQLMQQMYIVTRDGRRYAGAEGARYLTRRLPRLWPLAPLLHIPFSLPIWQWIYRQIARRRYQRNQTEPCDDTCQKRE
jgi:predicted DCC family thiol-disulfide oxidoreductase YuxK